MTTSLYTHSIGVFVFVFALVYFIFGCTFFFLCPPLLLLLLQSPTSDFKIERWTMTPMRSLTYVRLGPTMCICNGMKQNDHEKIDYQTVNWYIFKLCKQRMDFQRNFFGFRLSSLVTFAMGNAFNWIANKNARRMWINNWRNFALFPNAIVQKTWATDMVFYCFIGKNSDTKNAIKIWLFSPFVSRSSFTYSLAFAE